MGNVVYIKNIKHRIKRRLEIPIQNRSCENCGNYHKNLKNFHSHHCMVYPNGNFHEITINHCTPENGKRLWKPKLGIIRRFLNWLI